MSRGELDRLCYQVALEAGSGRIIHQSAEPFFPGMKAAILNPSDAESPS